MRLRLAGSSLACVARELGVQPTTVTSVCLGQRRSRRIEDLIAAKLDSTPAKLWPERYSDSEALLPLAREGGPSPSSDLR
ncbi:helix-turn-helix domain-containing protein [Chiayiivirga sp.]|uniref:helix-turn-helix domain-containing protein n=1 Tax=Chiayiivirga sp. TaxID=2041042 RepID=UPI003DA9F228